MTNFESTPLRRCPLPFVGEKQSPTTRVDALLDAARSENRFANFGPVSRQLERWIGDRLGQLSTVNRPQDRAAITCCSATLGLQGAAGTMAVRHGRPLRWVVSAYGFFSTFTGVFSQSKVVDCDRQGLLDLDAVAALDPDSYDGIVVTNPFGLFGDFAPFFDFCRDRGKAMLLDNAAGLGATHADRLPTSAAEVDWIEVVSFHHTKPLGMGEGGAAIMAEAARETFRAVINFGVGLPQTFAPFYTNGKLSDFAAAHILAHLEGEPQWGPAYVEQAARVIEAGRQAGLTPLSDGPFPAPPGQVGLLAEGPVAESALENPEIVLRTYYPPVHPGFAHAEDIWRRIVNVPTHPGVADLPDDRLDAVLRAIAACGRGESRNIGDALNQER